MVIREISARTSIDGECLVRFLDDPELIKLPLSPSHYTASRGGVQGSWCLQLRRGRSVARGIQIISVNMNLVGVQATTGLECFDPVFLVLNSASSGDIRFSSVFFLFSFPGGIFLVILRPVCIIRLRGCYRHRPLFCRFLY